MVIKTPSTCTWYSWKTLFAVWLYNPTKGANMAVSNMMGMPTWADWGSSMIWDSCFMMQFARYGYRAFPMIDCIDNCYARQHENGFICREADNGNHEVDAVAPVNLPLLAWGEWENYEITGDADRLKKVLLPLVKQYEWTMLYQRRTNGLYWNVGIGDGMDDNPRNDLARSWVTTTSVMAMSAQILEQMSKLSGRSDLADWFAGEYANLKSLINTKFWDAANGIYNDVGADDKPITVTEKGGVCKHVGDFWPMIAGVVPGDRAKLLAKALVDTKSFNRPCGTGSLSADSKYYKPELGDYWRGSVWPGTQYMVIKGLERCGNESVARQLALQYYNAFLTAYKNCGDIREYLAPEKPEMHGCGKFVGWGGLGPISMLFEDIMGVRLDAPANQITWRIRATERHGIRNLAFGDKTVSLICESRSKPSDPCSITVDSTGKFDLIVDVAGARVLKHIQNGHNTFQIKPKSPANNLPRDI